MFSLHLDVVHAFSFTWQMWIFLSHECINETVMPMHPFYMLSDKKENMQCFDKLVRNVSFSLN